MGRRERPLDPADGPVAAFAVDLRKLRAEAGGPTYRAMAARVHFSAATLAQAAAADKLPTLPVTLAYVAACGGDGRQWQARWEEAVAAAREAAASSGDAAVAPYRGLARFETADRAYFFGRGTLVDRLVTLVRAHRFVLVAGPSGCGKSSLLRAGLVPSLRERAVRVLTPGAHPRLAGAGVADVIVVDQFEETFTLCQDPAERQEFIDALTSIGRDDRDTRVVLAVRADFFGHCTHYPALIEAVRDSTTPVGPMSPAELREAIVRPAAAAGLIVQRELTARIVEEATGQPGGLPLMSHALLETWRRRQGKALTMAAYEAAGGIEGAVTRTAEDLYTDLTAERQERLRHLLLRLITPGEAGAHDTRRPVARAELETGESGDPGPLLLERLVAARLITLDDDTADLAHEALLTAWPRLRSWVEEDRERLRTHRHLTAAATAWEAHARDPGLLYRGLRLATTREKLTGHAETLTPHERAFLQAGTAAQHGEVRRRKLRTAAISVLVTLTLIAASLAWQQSAAGNRQEREAHARRIVGIAESLRQSDPRQSMRLSLGAWRLADLPETRANLRTASSQPQQDTFTDPDTTPGTVRWLSTDGRSLFSLGATRITRWDLDTRRAVPTASGPAVRRNDVGVGDGNARWLPVRDRRSGAVTVWDMTTGLHHPTPLDVADQGIEVASSGHGLITYQARGPSYRVRVWNPVTRRLIIEARTPRKRDPVRWERSPGEIFSAVRAFRNGRSVGERDIPDAVLSADDKTMALCVPGARLQLWDLETGRRRKASWAPTLTFRQCRDERLHLTPDGRQLLLVTDTRIRRWHLPSGTEARAIDVAGVNAISFSADGGALATASDTELQVRRMSWPDAPLFRHPLVGEHVFSLRIDPAADQVRYLAGSNDTTAWPARVRTLRLNSLMHTDWHDESANAAMFSPDGQKLAILYSDRVEVRDGRTGRRLPGPPRIPCPMDGPPSCFMIAAFRPDGRALAYGDAYHVPFKAEVWDLGGARISSASRSIPFATSLTFAWNNTTVLVSGPPAVEMNPRHLGMLTLWDLRTGAITSVPGPVGDKITINAAGGILITSEGHVADISSGKPVLRDGGPGPASALAFSPNGRFLAVGDAAGHAELWDGGVRRHLGSLATMSATGAVRALAFSPDAGMLAAGTADGDIQLWDTGSRQPIGEPIATPGGEVLGLTLTSDALYVAGEHVPLRRYDLTSAAAVAAICRRAGRGLTPDEWTTYFSGHPYQPACGSPAGDHSSPSPRSP